MTKRLLSLSLLLAAGSTSTHAQNTVLKVDTNMTTHSAGGFRFSAWAEPGSATWGTGVQQSLSNYVAEDFTIPTGTTWAIDSVIVYSYQTFTAPTSTPTNTFVSGTVQIYSGIPGNGGTLVAGDTVTNRYANASFTGIFRVDTINNTTNFARPVFRVALTGVPNILSAGSYWVVWALRGNATFTGPWANQRVILSGGVPSYPTGQNARVKSAGGGSVWTASTDIGVNVGYNFMLKGRLNPTSVADVSANGFSLKAPFPNPASGTTNIAFTLAQRSRVSVRIVNTAGQQVATVVEDDMTAGEYMIPFSTANLASGVYRVMLQTEAGSTTAPLTVK